MSNEGVHGPYQRVLMLGLDGLSAAFLRSPLVESTMPNLLGLLRDSSVGSLRSTVPPYTAPGWTSITTGMHPDRHGVFSFTDSAGRPVDSTNAAAPRTWDYVAAAGGRSIVVNVPMTHPPRPIEGVLVSGMPVPGDVPFTHPQDLAESLSERDYIIDTAVREGSREPVGALGRLRQMTEARGRVATWLARTHPWDLFAIVFVLPDRLGHPWWKLLFPGDRQYDSRRGERMRRAAAPALAALDEAIGDLLAAMPPSTAVVLCSDHGFGPLHADLFFDVALARAGLIQATPPRMMRRSLLAVGRSRASHLVPSAVRRWGTTRLSASRDEATRSAWTAPTYECGVRLLDPEDDDIRDQVTRLLRGLRDPDGSRVFAAVRDREELYRGPFAARAPELLCETASQSVDLHDGLHAREPWVSRDASVWGTHAAEGVVAMNGPAIAGSIDGQAPDITPTILNLLGLEAPGLDGKPLGPQSQRTRLVSPAGYGGPQDSYSEKQENEVLDHLRALGYVD